MGLRRVRRWFDAAAVVQSAAGRRPPEATLSVPVTEEERQAEWRWHYANEEARKKGCPCGAPAQVAEAYHEVTGTVPYLWWTCEEHAGAQTFSSVTVNGVTTYGRPGFRHSEPCPLGEYMGEGGTIGEPSDHFFCPHRTHEARG